MTKPTMLNLKKDVTYEKLISVSKIEAQIYSSLIATSQLRNFNIRQWFPFFTKTAGKLHVIHQKWQRLSRTDSDSFIGYQSNGGASQL